jgi:hypothetical protein
MVDMCLTLLEIASLTQLPSHQTKIHCARPGTTKAALPALKGPTLILMAFAKL